MDKVQIYQELERRGELGKLPAEKQAIWAEYKRRQDKPKYSQADFSSKFNTSLTPDEESRYQEWLKTEGRKDDVYDYDTRGFWKEMSNGGLGVASNGHLSDKYKKPNHPTYSNESIYKLDGYTPGYWSKNSNGSFVFHAPSDMEQAKKDWLVQYFKENEQGNNLLFDKHNTLTPGQRAWNSFKEDIADLTYAPRKALSGATLGASDWALRKLGVGYEDTENRMGEVSPLAKGLTKVGGFGAELGGNISGLGGGLVKALAGKGLKGLKLGMASGGIEGLATGATSSDTLSELPKNVALGGIIGTGGGMLGEGLTYLARPFSARSLTKGMKGGLNNVVENPEAVKLLNQGIKQSDDVASEFLLKSRPVARGINKDTANMVDSALTSRVDVPEAIRSANEKYGKYMDEHGADQIYSMLSPEEQKAANFAKFFEGSKVVDESGKPLTVYHGTDVDFDVFDPEKSFDGAFYFTPDEQFAKNYSKGYLKPAYVSIKNPTDMIPMSRNQKKLLEQQGYDGVIYKGGSGERIVAAFSPNQIKSIDNSGAFNINSPSLSDAGWTPEPYIGSLYEGLNPFQAKSLKGAIARGGEKLEKGAKLGSVDHFNKIKQDINSQISDLVVRKGKEGDVRLLEILKSSVDNKAPKELKVVDKIYEKAKRLQDAFERGTHYNPNNVEGADYISELSPLEQNAFAQGLFKRINNNSLTGKNLANTALGYENTLASVLRGDKYDDLMKGLNKQSTKFERLAGLGRKAESKLNTPEAQRLFAREQLESKGSRLGTAIDWANSTLRRGALERAGKNLLNPNYVGDSEAWLIENYPIIAGYLSSKLNQEVNQ